MIGGFVHERVILDTLEQQAHEVGAQTKRQAKTRSGCSKGFMDLVIEDAGKRIGIEAELSAKRIANDLRKAMELQLSELWIVVVDRRSVKAVRHSLKRMHIRPECSGIFLLTLGEAKQRLMNCFPFFSRSFVRQEKQKTNHEK